MSSDDRAGRKERIERDKQASAKAFHDHVWPILRRHLGRNVIMVEGRDDDLARQLDACGIDAVQVERSGDLIGIASRTLLARPEYFGPGFEWHVSTGFSLRYRRGENLNVEYQRFRRYYLEADGASKLRPYYCVQAVFLDSREEPPVYVACVRAEELVRFIDANKDAGMVRIEEFRKDGGAGFYCVSSDDLRRGGVQSLYEHYEIPQGRTAFKFGQMSARMGETGRNCEYAYVVVDEERKAYYEDEIAMQEDRMA